MTGYYWHLSPDALIPKWAKGRVSSVIPEFEQLIAKAADKAGYSNEQLTLGMTNQRLDFMINIVEQFGIYIDTKLAELCAERDRRRSLENGQPD